MKSNRALFTLLFGGLLFVALTFQLPSAAKTSQGPSNLVAGDRDENRVRSIGVLGSSAGWLLTERLLMWSGDDGATWREAFTAPQDAVLWNTLFLDDATGWIIVSGASGVDIVRTTDSATTWQHSAVTLPEGEPPTDGSLSFIDPQRGWLLLRLPSSSNSSRGALFRTENGGRSWEGLATPPIAGQIRFVSKQDGWLVGGPSGGTLFVTRDGGRSWSEVELTGNRESAAQHILYSLPHFTTASDGLLPVRIETPTSAAIALYVTNDGGRTWTQVGTDINVALGGGPSALANGTFFAAVTGAKLVKFTPGHEAEVKVITPTSSRSPAPSAISLLSFADSQRGWIATVAVHCTGFKASCWQENRLLSTHDGAVSFVEITPPILSKNIRRAEPGDDVPRSSTGDQPLSPTAGTRIALNEDGFDRAYGPSTSQMQNLWNNSTYRYVGAYIGGVHAYCVNHPSCPDSTWYSQVAAIGWSFIPIWVGPQELYGDLSANTGTAFNQGVAEGDLAANQLTALGFPANSIVYYDFERPHPAAIEPSVKAFVNGWSSQLHNRGHLAGIYGSYLSAAAWQGSGVPNPPDAIWPYNLNVGRTVFGLCGPSYCLPDSLWNSHQRIHQYTQDVTEPLTGINIDQDFADGPVATYGGSTHPPTPALTVRSVSSTNVQVNQPFTVSTTLAVSNGTADHAGISISFPSLTNSGVSGTPPNESYNSIQGTVTTASSSSITGGSTLRYYDAGDTITCAPSSPCPAQHLLVEGDWVSVGAGNTRSLNLTVTPKVVGTFKVRIRGWATAPIYQNPSRDPASGSTNDQQGFPVYEVTVTVSGTPPPAPTANAATSVTNSSFTTNWSASSGATGYRLDVSTSSSFGSFVSGYQDLDVGNVLSRSVTGLSAGTNYYYRVRAYNSTGPSGNSGTISVTTSAQNYTITLSPSPTVGGTVSGGGTFAAGSSRTVTATANNGYTFVNWTESGSVVNSSASYTFTLNANRTLVANFTANPVNYTITLSASPGSGGSVNGAGTFAAGSSRTVTATANSGYTFSNWTEGGSVVSSSASYTFTLNSNRNLIANFTSTPGGNAVYDSTLKAPKCGQPGSVCDSGTLLNGRDSITGGQEPNQPNTIYNSCADNTSGSYHSDESIDRLKVSTLDGSNFAPGKTVKIEATVWAFSITDDFLDLFYTADATNPNWTYIGTLVPSGAGAQVLSTTYTLPSGGSLQAVRANFLYQGAVLPCGGGGSFDDHDDLIFAASSSVTRTLTVASSNPASGVSITVSPNDNDGQGSGVTQFTRVYNNNTNVNLTAPSTAGGNNFQKWQLDGVDFTTSLLANLALDANHTMTAVYVSTIRTLTVASNPSSGISITVSPNDNNGQGSGTTPVTRTYNNNTSVSLTAPSSASGNNFQKWQRDGSDWSTSLTTNVTMDANHTMTAVYVTAPPTPTPLQLLLEESGPASNQVAALDSVLFLRDPFPVVNGADLLNLGVDRNTRAIVFVMNLQLAQGETSSSVVVNLIDSNNQSYDVAAEDIQLVPNFDFTQVIFRLPNNLPAGTCTIRIKAHGQVSNAGTIRIRM